MAAYYSSTSSLAPLTMGNCIGALKLSSSHRGILSFMVLVSLMILTDCSKKSTRCSTQQNAVIDENSVTDMGTTERPKRPYAPPYAPISPLRNGWGGTWNVYSSKI